MIDNLLLVRQTVRRWYLSPRLNGKMYAIGVLGVETRNPVADTNAESREYVNAESSARADGAG
jgi:hypothetical protein